MPDSQERVQRYNKMKGTAAEFYTANSWLDGNVIVTDLRGKEIHPANRFLIYTLPGLEEGNISVRIADGKKGEFSSLAVGHSIVNRTSSVDCGELCRKYGGGGHRGAAACQPSIEESDRVLKEIIAACKE
jgi:nanoRNase/pAp phosphatase (c-di-AMP/oligoRNAs hydrolase)